jgi:DNA-binding response OmpR family regulator
MKILIVDDEPQILHELPKAFVKFYPDAIINTAWSYIKAEELLKENIYEIILLDGQISDHITDPWQHGFGYCLVEPIRNSSSKQAKIIMISTDEG